LNVSNLTVTAGNDEFYPTPEPLAVKLLSMIESTDIRNILEPSAGKGDLVRAIIKKNYTKYGGRSTDVDCIEIDPYLRQILKFEFSEAGQPEIFGRYYALRDKYYDERTKKEQRELDQLEEQIAIIHSAEVRVIHDDFLTYNGVKRYDLIIMNPPFSNGDEHLLKAIDIQKDGGEVVCLLNAETIRNPYTNTRQHLKRLLDKYGAKVRYVENAFVSAERTANVDVAIISVCIPREQERTSEFWERMKKAHVVDKQNECTDVAVTDFLENMITMYNVEVAASLNLINEYNALKPKISRSIKGEYSSAILTLTVGTDGNCCQVCDINKYLHQVRAKYWEALLNNKQFTGNLTSNLQKKYHNLINKMADYDFTKFNIQAVIEEMNSELVQGVKDTILAIFDKLSVEHSHYPECQNNIHYYNGWRTNKAHKVNEKVIIPTYGMFSNYSWSKQTFSVTTAYEVLSDIEKVFNYLDGGMTENIDLDRVLNIANDNGQKLNIECKYFTVSLYKKGTTHIKFKNMALVDKLNIYAARNRMWLPPNYGKTHYNGMSAEEKKAIDEFQGAEAYAKVMADTKFYLFDATASLLAIEQKTEPAVDETTGQYSLF